MKNIKRQFKKDLEKIKLLNTEKDHIRSSILGDFEYSKSVSSPFFIFSMNNLKFASFAFIFIFAIGTPFVFAAQDSNPGDMLYKFEINVIENIEEKFIFSNDAKLIYQKNRLEERLKEIQYSNIEDTTSYLLTLEKINEHKQEIIDLTLNQKTDEHTIDYLTEVAALENVIEKTLEDKSIENLGSENVIEETLNTKTEEYSENASEEVLINEISENVQEISADYKNFDIQLENSISEGIVDINQFVQGDEIKSAYRISNDLKVLIKTDQYQNREE